MGINPRHLSINTPTSRHTPLHKAFSSSNYIKTTTTTKSHLSVDDHFKCFTNFIKKHNLIRWFEMKNRYLFEFIFMFLLFFSTKTNCPSSLYIWEFLFKFAPLQQKQQLLQQPNLKWQKHYLLFIGYQKTKPLFWNLLHFRNWIWTCVCMCWNVWGKGGTNLQMSDSVGIPALAPGSAGSATGTLIHLPPENTPAFYIPNRMPYNPSKYQ